MFRKSIGSSLSLAALSLAASLGVPAFAEEAERVEETIIVTDKRAANEAEALVLKTPGGADVVTHEEFADKFLVSLRDTLAFTPGVYTQPRYGQEVRISIRGSGISRSFHMRGLTLLQDGVPINLADNNGDFQELEPIFFDYLEVYRGSNALRFGSGTLGGAINGVTPTGRTSEGVYVRADAGSFNTFRALISAGYAGDKLDAWGALSADQSDGDRDHAKRNSVRFQGNLGYQISDDVETRFYLSLNQIDQELPGALTMDEALNSPERGNFVNDQGRDIDSIRVQNKTTFDLGSAGELSVGGYLNDKHLFHPIFQVIDYQSTDQGVFGRWNWAGKKTELTLGGDYRKGGTDAQRYANIDGGSGSLTYSARQEAWTANLYGELRYGFTPDLSAIVGGVYTKGEREQQQDFNLFQGGPTDFFGTAEFDEFSPKFGLLWQSTPDIQVYANYSASAELPGFSELAQVATFVPVDAQTAWTFEVGTRGRHGMAAWDLTAYRSDIDGEMLQFTTGPDIPASTFNADETVHQGIEAGLSLDFNDWVQLRQIYTWSDFHFEGDAQFGDNTLPVIPEHVYRAELRIGNERMHVSPVLEWIPDGPYADYANSVQSDGYVLLGVSGGWKVRDGVDLFLDARNLTDENAIGDVGAVIQADANSRIYYPVERRAVFGGIRARF